jgi:hypothetical protein
MIQVQKSSKLVKITVKTAKAAGGFFFRNFENIKNGRRTPNQMNKIKFIRCS